MSRSNARFMLVKLGELEHYSAVSVVSDCNHAFAGRYILLRWHLSCEMQYHNHSHNKNTHVQTMFTRSSKRVFCATLLHACICYTSQREYETPSCLSTHCSDTLYVH